MKNVVFLDVTLSGSSKNRSFGETYRLHHQVERISELSLSSQRTSVVSYC
jgi:hypothetical protein